MLGSRGIVSLPNLAMGSLVIQSSVLAPSGGLYPANLAISDLPAVASVVDCGL